jgi:hypothetical protein
MKCIQCSKEFTSQRATAKFCSAQCRKLAFQKKAVSVPVSVPAEEKVSVPVSVPAVISEPKLSVPLSVPQPETAPENSTQDFSKYTADELYIGINSYEGSLWSKSPEYKELIKRLDKLSITQLREQGFQVPLWKLNNQPCPF